MKLRSTVYFLASTPSFSSQALVTAVLYSAAGASSPSRLLGELREPIDALGVFDRSCPNSRRDIHWQWQVADKRRHSFRRRHCSQSECRMLSPCFLQDNRALTQKRDSWKPAQNGRLFVIQEQKAKKGVSEPQITVNTTIARDPGSRGDSLKVGTALFSGRPLLGPRGSRSSETERT